MSSPALVIRRWLIDSGLAPDSGSAPWAPFAAFLPDNPDTAIGIYDTTGVLQGRIMATGEQIEKPGVQVRVRSADYKAAYAKADEIRLRMDSLLPIVSVVLPGAGEEWQLSNIARTASITYLGIEESGDRKRHNLTINATLTIKKIT